MVEVVHITHPPLLLWLLISEFELELWRDIFDEDVGPIEEAEVEYRLMLC